MYTAGSKSGILYRLAKIQKPATDNLPSFYPILLTTGTNTCMLDELTNNQYAVRDSFVFYCRTQKI